MRLFDRSSTDTVLQSTNASNDSREFKKLFDTFSDVSVGKMDEPQFSMHLILLCDKFSVSKLVQNSRFSIFFGICSKLQNKNENAINEMLRMIYYLAYGHRYNDAYSNEIILEK